MNEKLVINIDEIIQRVKYNFEETYNKIKAAERPCELTSEVDRFFSCVDEAIVCFFYSNNAGDVLKKMYSMVGDNRMVKSMDFGYAWDQYKEYLCGMKKYVREAQDKVVDTSEIEQMINDIILKDDDFIKSLFLYGENKNNTEKEMPLIEALKCVNTLFPIRDAAKEFMDETCTGTLFDKLYLLSKMNVMYYSVTGIMKQTERIVAELNGEVNSSSEVTSMYAVF